jgi:Zn-finger nucleic acid-binding protein
MICPCCSVRMTKQETHGVVVDTCDSCDGIWFEPDQLKEYFRSAFKDSKSSSNTDFHFRILVGSGTTHCPKCSALSLHCGATSTVPFHSCMSCDGVFLCKRDIPLLFEAKKCAVCGEAFPPDKTTCVSEACKTRSWITGGLWAALVTSGLALLVWYLGWVSDHIWELVPWWWW